MIKKKYSIKKLIAKEITALMKLKEQCVRAAVRQIL